MTPKARTPARESGTATESAWTESFAPDGSTAYTCEYCGRPFAREGHLALHRGLEHASALSEAQRDAFEDARDAEERDIRRFRIVALGALVALYFGLLFAYAIFG